MTKNRACAEICQILARLEEDEGQLVDSISLSTIGDSMLMRSPPTEEHVSVSIEMRRQPGRKWAYT